MAWRPNWNDDDDRGGGGGRYRQVHFGGMGSTEGTRTILMVTIGAFVLQMILRRPTTDPLIDAFGLDVQSAVSNLQIWRFLTFQFLHGDTMHIFWNMFVFYMFGRTVEMQLGTRKFLSLYLLSGIAGGLAQVAVTYVMAQQPQFAYMLQVPTVGASAGVAGVTIAFAVRNPNSLIYIFFILPVKAKWAAVGYVALTTWWMLQSFSGARADNVAHAAHLGGMVYAFLWMLADSGARRGGRSGPWQWIRSKFGGGQGGRQRMSGGDARGGWQGRSGSSSSFSHPVTGRSEGSSGINSQEEERLDQILRKVHTRGLGALSEEERDFLHRVSAKKRDSNSI